jgi:hypothetical protein
MSTRAPSHAPPASRPGGADPFAALIAWDRAHRAAEAERLARLNEETDR